MPAGAGAAGWYWIGDPGQNGSGDWNAPSPNLWNPNQDGSGTPGIPASGDTANVWQGSNSADLVTVTYSGTNYSSSQPLGAVTVKNTAATGNFTDTTKPIDTGIGWIMLDQTGGSMYTNSVKIGPLGVYKIEGGTLTVESSLSGGLWTPGTLGAGGLITDTDNNQPYEGGVVYQTGGTVNAAAVSLGWSSVRNLPADAVYALVNGTLTVADDTSGGTLVPGSPTPGAMYVGNGGNGNFWQGSGFVTMPTSGAIYTNSIAWNYVTGVAPSVTADSLYVGLSHGPVNGTTYYGNGYYELLYGTLTVNKNAYIGLGGSSTSASQGDFQQGYSNQASDNSYQGGVVGDGKSLVTVNGSLYLGLSSGPGQPGGSGSYELYNGTLVVNGSGPQLVTGTNGGIYIGFGGSQESEFTQGKTYQDPMSGAWKTSSADNLTNTVTAPNLYIGMNNASTSSSWAQYTLSDGNLTISGNTYLGYNGSGGFTQGQGWDHDGNPFVTPGGTFTTGSLYLGYNSYGSGSYTLANGTLTVNGTTYIGYNGSGGFTQGQAYGYNTTILTPGGTFTTGNLYVGYGTNGYASGYGSYTLANGTLNVNGTTYIGSNGWGTFTQGQAWDYSGNQIATPGGTFTTGSLYVGYNSGTYSSGSGTYTLANGTLNVNGTTYVGSNGWGMFNQSGGVHSAGSILVGAKGTYNYSGGTITGALQNGGQVNVTGGTASAPNTFAASVTNNTGGTFNANNAYVNFVNAVLNNSGATFTINNSNVTFQSTFLNYGALVTDPSTVIFKGIYTSQNGGTIFGSSGDTWEFLGAGANTVDLGGKTVNLAALVLGPGVTLNVTDGSLIVNYLSDPTGSNTGITGVFTATGYGKLDTVPLPSALWLFAPGLAGLISLRRRAGKK